LVDQARPRMSATELMFAFIVMVKGVQRQVTNGVRVMVRGPRLPPRQPSKGSIYPSPSTISFNLL
jgi:hypothetical protein